MTTDDNDNSIKNCACGVTQSKQTRGQRRRGHINCTREILAARLAVSRSNSILAIGDRVYQAESETQS